MVLAKFILFICNKPNFINFKISKTNQIVTIITNTTYLDSNITSIIILGTGFSSNSTIQLSQNYNNNSICGSVQYISINQLICKNIQNLINGPLYAVVNSSYGTSPSAQISTINDA